MATWKERGEVPDSDEDDDYEFDNADLTASKHAFIHNEGVDDSRRHDVEPETIGSVEPADNKHPTKRSPNVEDEDGTNHGEGSEAADVGSNESIEQEKEISRDVYRSSSRDSPYGRRTTSASSTPPVSSERTILDPLFSPLWFEKEDQFNISHTGQFSPTLTPLPAAADDISRSFVQLNVPVSSSPLASLPSLSQIVRPQGHQAAKPTVEIPLPSFSAPKRTFRRRKQIQLHPYEIEQQKYQRTLKERGIAPIHIINSQDERRRAELESNQESPVLGQDDNDSSDDGFLATEDSQLRNNDLETQSSQLTGSLHLIHSPKKTLPSDNQFGSDEEEFPDIDSLLKDGSHATSQRFFNRTKTYSLKHKRRRLSTASQLHSPAYDIGSVENRLVSPAPSSSPPQAANRRTLSRVASAISHASSSIDLPMFIDDDQQDSLPTPATSSVRRPPPIHIDSDADDGSGSGRILDNEEKTGGSSSDESAKLIRHIGKRVRGVLPASHLRLSVQQRRKSPIGLRQTTRSVSPPPIRKGVALPALRRATQAVESSPRLALLEDFSDGEDEEDGVKLLNQRDVRSEHESLFTESRLGIAEEDDRVDPMFPSLQRHRSTAKRPVKRRKTGLIKQPKIGLPPRQPKITEHMQTTENIRPASKKRPAGDSRKPRTRYKKARTTRVTPKLSILDVMPFSQPDIPLFLKVAARTVRERQDLGRQSPSRKFIRLATREDTSDAQSVLRDWKEHRILPQRDLCNSNNPASSRALRQIVDNRQSFLPSPGMMPHAEHVHTEEAHDIQSKKLVVARTAHRNVKDYTAPADYVAPSPRKLIVNSSRATGKFIKSKQSWPHVRSTNRPGQLEAENSTSTANEPQLHFRTAKHALDRLYKVAHKRTQPQNNLPLTRYLAQDRATILFPALLETHDIDDASTIQPLVVKSIEKQPPTRKARRPRRLDVGALTYRQPSEQLTLEIFNATEVAGQPDLNASKLSGLGKYGIRYPITFDITPLPAGVFFHRQTFVGSGRLAKALANEDIRHEGQLPTRFDIGDKQFVWSEWNETVSSELGICFDWIFEQLNVEDLCEIESADDIAALGHILQYIQHKISFAQAVEVASFLTRTHVILKDFSKALGESLGNLKKNTRLLNAMRDICLICFRSLIIARLRPDNSHQAFQFEGLLSIFLQAYMNHLDTDLTAMRQFYDKLQYLSYRERGVHSEHACVEHWVVIIRIAAMAGIQRGSFWDMFNNKISLSSIKDCTDAQEMEKIWSSMFAVLPLCEFDDYGVLISNQRHNAKFDGWMVPQQTVKRVGALYALNQRQSPSFSEYCKALLSRCHYLMVEWGWWNCRGIIGTIFDFFASQKLEHLRNEEAHASPHFLRELHLDPSLAVESQDLCFHIFLKMVALGIKHLSQANENKHARNLVTRLLPNHDRQYLKEEEIHQRDLASLRNHHDLLCTLFWSAPAENKPSVTLIQKLVVVEQSHTLACKINFFAWENVLRYVASCCPTMDLVNPLATWHKSSLDALWRQYADAEIEVRRDAEDLSNRDSVAITENQIQEAVKANRIATKSVLSMMLQAIGHVRNFNMPINVAMHFFDIKFLARICQHRPVTDFSASLINILQYYIWLVGRPAEESDVLEDSQDSVVNVLERYQAITDFAEVIVEPLKGHLQALMSCVTQEIQSNDSVACWTSLITLLAEEEIPGYNFLDFIGRGRHALFDHTKSQTAVDNRFWTAMVQDFVSRYVGEQQLAAQMYAPKFNVEGEWLRILALPPTTLQVATAIDITLKLHSNGSSLLRLPVTPDGFAIFDRGKPNDDKDDALIRRLQPRLILKWAITSIKAIMDGPPGARGFEGTAKRAKDYFAPQLKYLMISMKDSLMQMEVGSTEHIAYVTFVQEICEDIQVYCSAVGPLEDFFQKIGTHYWPPLSDPHRFAPSAKSFALELAGPAPRKAAMSLFYFLQSGFDGSLTRGEFRQHTINLRNAMQEVAFLRFVLDEMFAPMVEMGFGVSSVPGGWLFCMAYLPVLSSVLRVLLLDREAAVKLLRNDDAVSTVYNWSIKAAETVSFYLQLHEASYYDGNDGGLNSRFQEILALSLDFWQALLPGLRKYQSMQENFDAEYGVLESTFNTLATNIRATLQGDHPPPTARLFTSTARFRGANYEEFRHGLEQYVLDNWMVSRGEDCIFLKKTGIRVVFGPLDGGVVRGLSTKSVGVRRPDLRRSLIEFEQGVLDGKSGRMGRLIAGVI